MPNPIIKSFAKKSGKDIKYIEDMWNKVLLKVKETYKDKNEDDQYSIVVGILKKNLNIKEDADAAITTSTAGDVSSYGGEGNFAPKLGVMMTRFGDMKPKKKKVNEVNEYIDNFLLVEKGV